MMNNAPFPDLRGEHRAEPVPPKTHRFVTDVDTAFGQKIFDPTQRQRIPDVHHHRQTDDFGGAVEITEGVFHPGRLRTALPELKPLYSDNAPVMQHDMPLASLGYLPPKLYAERAGALELRHGSARRLVPELNTVLSTQGLTP